MNDAPVTGFLRKANIKTENHLMDFSGSSWQDFPDTGRITGSYIIFYQGGPIDHDTYVPVPVDQAISESEYNAIVYLLTAHHLNSDVLKTYRAYFTAHRC